MASLKENASGLLLPEDFDAPVGSGVVAAYSSPEEAHEAGLAILAMGQAYWLLPHEEQFLLFVATAQVERVRRELEAIARLGNQVVVAEPKYQEFRFGPSCFFAYIAVLVAIFIIQQFEPIVEEGRVSSERMIVAGEWWRAITALTLHADIVHLVSNLVSGLGFAFFVSRFFGAASGWFLILVAGGLGNALNAWIHHPEPHLSIGASTAVFGALGIITGIGLWAALVQPAERWTLPRWLLPAFGGLTLLGLLGLGEGLDGSVDVAAHISGFLCGGILGLIGAFRQSAFLRLGRYGALIGLIALGLVGLCWGFALS